MPSVSTFTIFWPYIDRSVGRLLRTLEGLDDAELNWKPLSTANSLYSIAEHVLGNVAENFLEVIGGQTVGRQREAEFLAGGQTAEPLLAQWANLRGRIEALLTQLPETADQMVYRHPRRGDLTGLDVLLVVARHTAEHVGEAELTRHLILARRGTSRQTA